MLDAKDIASALTPGTALLRGQYQIDRQIGQGGFGLTYLARDSLGRSVVIKECFPAEICMRDNGEVVPLGADCVFHFQTILEQFQTEAQQLAGLDHPGIVGVHQVFAENGTAYMAMDVVEGDDLFTVSETSPERLTPATAESVLRQTLEATRYLHDRGVLHRDIAPDNLIMGEDGHVTLIDFGAAYSFGDAPDGHSRRMLAVKDGYSPPEFYDPDAIHDTHSDLYSLGALFYFLLMEEAPPEADYRVKMVATEAGDPYQSIESAELDLDLRLVDAADRALSLNPEDRPRSAKEWIEALDGPMPKRVPRFDPAVIEVIAALVQKTNCNLTPGLPRALRQTIFPGEEQRTEPEPPKQFVDIFGNPIKDVAAYLDEQDRICRAKKRIKKKVSGSVKPGNKEMRLEEPDGLASQEEQGSLTDRLYRVFRLERHNPRTQLCQN